VYGQEYEKAKTSSEKVSLAKKLLSEASQSSDDPVSRFALLKVARDVAVQAGDAVTALEAVDAIAEVFDVDRLEMKVAAIVKLGELVRFTTQNKALAGGAADLIDEAIAADDYKAAKQLVDVGLAAARGARDGAQVKSIVARKKEVEKAAIAFAEARASLAVLEESPVDAEANLAVGKFYCFVKGDWEKGIPMLALGGDPALRALAVGELEEPRSSEEMVKLGDGWWALGQEAGGEFNDSLRLHAAFWYRRAEPRLASGLAKVKVRKRLAQIDEVERETSAPEPPRKAPSRWLGFTVRRQSGTSVKGIAACSNFVLDRGWPDYGDALIQAAGKSGLKVILAFHSADRDGVEARVIPLARQHPDVVWAVCWNSPYYGGYRPEALSQFGRNLEEELPNVEFWASFVEKPHGNVQTLPVPDEVDLLIVDSYFCATPQEVQQKANDCLAGWIQKANGRPVLQSWIGRERKPPGLVPKCKPGTMLMCGQVTVQYNLAGLLIDGYGGDDDGHVGIEMNPAMVAEIRQVARGLGISASKKTRR